MLSLWIVHKDLKLWLREKQTFLILIAMPLLLIGILGLAFSSMLSSDEEVSSLGPYQLIVVDLDQSEHSLRIQDELLAVHLGDMIQMEKLSLTEAEEGLASQTIEHMLLLPAGLGEAISSGAVPKVELVSTSTSEVLPQIITNAMQQYGSIVAGIDGVIAVLTRHYTELTQQGEWIDPSAIEQTMSKQYDSLAQPIIETSVKGDDRKTIGSFQYYAVAMGVMYLLMTVVMLITVMIKEKNEEVYRRQFTTKLTTSQFLAGKFLGILFIGFLQLSILIVGTSLIYQVDWGQSVAGILLTMISFTVSTSGLAAFVGSLIQKESTFSAIGMVGTQIFAALGGSFVPIYFFPEFLQKIGYFIPNSLALTMFLEVMSGGAVSDIWQEACIAIAAGLLFMLLAWVRLARNGGVSRV